MNDCHISDLAAHCDAVLYLNITIFWLRMDEEFGQFYLLTPLDNSSRSLPLLLFMFCFVVFDGIWHILPVNFCFNSLTPCFARNRLWYVLVALQVVHPGLLLLDSDADALP